MSEIRLRALLDVNEGKEAEARAALEALTTATRERDTRTLQYDACMTADGRVVMMDERYADGDALIAHAQNIGAELGALMGLSSPRALVLVGDVPDAAKEMLSPMGAIYTQVVFRL